ncbi:MAG: coiled-coil domain-containing protein [Vampirovibrionales bacterium]
MTNTFIEEFKNHPIHPQLEHYLNSCTRYLESCDETEKETIELYRQLLVFVKETINAPQIPVIPRQVLDNILARLNSTPSGYGPANYVHFYKDYASFYGDYYSNIMAVLSQVPQLRLEDKISQLFSQLKVSFIEENKRTQKEQKALIQQYQEIKASWEKDKEESANTIDKLSSEVGHLQSEINTLQDQVKTDLANQYKVFVDEKAKLEKETNTLKEQLTKSVQNLEAELKQQHRTLLESQKAMADQALSDLNTTLTEAKKLESIN